MTRHGECSPRRRNPLRGNPEDVVSAPGLWTPLLSGCEDVPPCREAGFDQFPFLVGEIDRKHAIAVPERSRSSPCRYPRAFVRIDWNSPRIPGGQSISRGSNTLMAVSSAMSMNRRSNVTIVLQCEAAARCSASARSMPLAAWARASASKAGFSTETPGNPQKARKASATSPGKNPWQCAAPIRSQAKRLCLQEYLRLPRHLLPGPIGRVRRPSGT